jgi:hypothetical protein
MATRQQVFDGGFQAVRHLAQAHRAGETRAVLLRLDAPNRDHLVHSQQNSGVIYGCRSDSEVDTMDAERRVIGSRGMQA